MIFLMPIDNIDQNSSSEYPKSTKRAIKGWYVMAWMYAEA